MNNERRRFFRIEDVIGLKTQVIDQQQVNEKLDDFLNNRHQYSLLNEFNFELEQHQADLRHIKDKMPEVGRYLEVLQKQIDTLTERVLQDDDSFVELNKNVNLSAQGISFFSDESVNPGDVIELHLQLFPERHKIVTFARVVSCQKNTEEPGTFKVALDFEHIHDADQELLVKHVHGKQLRALGAARFEEDAE